MPGCEPQSCGQHRGRAEDGSELQIPAQPGRAEPRRSPPLPPPAASASRGARRATGLGGQRGGRWVPRRWGGGGVGPASAAWGWPGSPHRNPAEVGKLRHGGGGGGGGRGVVPGELRCRSAEKRCGKTGDPPVLGGFGLFFSILS